MSKYHGNNGIIEIGSSNALAEVQNWSYTEEDVNIADGSAMGDTEEEPIASGCKRGSGSIECYWDDTDADGQGALVVGDSVSVILYPVGSASGRANYTGTVVVSKVEHKGGKTDLIGVSFEFKGVLTKGTVA